MVTKLTKLVNLLFFYQGFLSWTLTTTGQQGREGTIFYSTLPLPRTLAQLLKTKKE